MKRRNSGAFLGKPKEGPVKRNLAVVGERARPVSGGEKDGMQKTRAYSGRREG